MTLRRAACVSIWICLAASRAFAQAQSLQKISVAPASPTVGQQVAVTVEGNNPCGAVGITYGDGETIVYPISALPLTQTHAYRTAGEKTVSAQGHGNCTGQVSTKVVVSTAPARPAPPPAAPTRSLEELCRQLDCGGQADSKPVVTEVFGVNRPGGTAAIVGRNLGTSGGIIRANLKRRDGSALVQELDAVSWNDRLIEVNWPASLPGVADQDATIQVETTNHLRSADYGPVPYHPVRISNQRDENAKVQAEMARRLRDQPPQARQAEVEAIRREARELWLKVPSASPAERAAIDQRAAELLARLARLRL